jgi:hypothetical protein
MINMTIRELYRYCTFADFSKNWNFRWVPLHIINLAKLRWAGGGGSGDIKFFRVPRRSFRVRRSSVGCSVDQKGTAELSRVQRSLEGRSLAQWVGAA